MTTTQRVFIGRGLVDAFEAAIGTCQRGHTTRTARPGVFDCPACKADPAVQAERAAWLAAHPTGFFPISVRTRAIRARVTRAECGDECRTARGDKCACACGGEGHGAGWAA